MFAAISQLTKCHTWYIIVSRYICRLACGKITVAVSFWHATPIARIVPNGPIVVVGLFYYVCFQVKTMALESTSSRNTIFLVISFPASLLFSKNHPVTLPHCSTICLVRRMVNAEISHAPACMYSSPSDCAHPGTLAAKLFSASVASQVFSSSKLPSSSACKQGLRRRRVIRGQSLAQSLRIH